MLAFLVVLCCLAFVRAKLKIKTKQKIESVVLVLVRFIFYDTCF